MIRSHSVRAAKLSFFTVYDTSGSASYGPPIIIGADEFLPQAQVNSEIVDKDETKNKTTLTS
ncbi:MAG: hypothetical protein AAB478_00135 [Patescibacteria group bacterium]